MLLERLGQKYPDKLEVKIYRAGKDFSYIKKYGMIIKGTLIINQKKKYDNLNKRIITQIIESVVNEKEGEM